MTTPGGIAALQPAGALRRPGEEARRPAQEDRSSPEHMAGISGIIRHDRDTATLGEDMKEKVERMRHLPAAAAGLCAPGGEETVAAQWARTAAHRRLYEGLLVSRQGGSLISGAAVQRAPSGKVPYRSEIWIRCHFNKVWVKMTRET